MFLNRSVPQPHPKVEIKSVTASPNYVELVRFLIQPFLESPESLSVDCEISQTLNRAWIRIAFDSTDKGKVFGRGGRNIQAIRTVIAAAAAAAGQSVYLDIYGSATPGREGTSFDEDGEERSPPPKTRERGGNGPSRPIAKPRFR
ncbi:KH domain-containing protein [Nostoc minutum NIES-26]|uniref:KH domain-containing protein n=1 Tax=Nostoc minutum NIES-26 TaxID=1844469 RepID=A0A367QL00_9NOSO|nr:KH domain-containing protein [Dendronalium sp. ChiSLP03b]MDZ8208570.1 KH domain-containing protein [Dendronalium sp. ChiSLP03b]RCJ23852.1 KH domain-containing protein [Nostoc minutum NIES-26]